MVAALSSKHPNFIGREIDWTMMRDSYAGERFIKEKAEAYLPATTSHVQEGLTFGQPGWHNYRAYLARAVYHELTKPALMAMLGVMHRKPADIQLPPRMEPMRDNATFEGESLDALMQKTNEQQMLMGRYGLLLDVKTGAKVNELPYIIGYNAESIINWDSTKIGEDAGRRTLNLVVLNESGYERRAGLQWSQIERYRVLALAGSVADVWPDIDAPADAYVAAEVRQATDVPGTDFVTPTFGGKPLNAIPFVFVGPRDLVPEPDMPMLMPLARISLAIYRTEADYRQALYMQGQDTLVVIGQQADVTGNRTRVGAFASIDLPPNGDAKYIGADSGGIDDLATSIQNDLKRAAQLGAQLLSERGNEAEAGNALAIRVASRTATLTTAAKTGAAALQQILRHAAVWLGEDPAKVIVTPNLDFADDPAQAQDLVYMQTAKNMGFPISQRSIHGWAQKREFTTLDFEEEQKELDKEPAPVVPPSLTQSRGLPDKAATVSKQQVKGAGGNTSDGSAGPNKGTPAARQ